MSKVTLTLPSGSFGTFLPHKSGDPYRTYVVLDRHGHEIHRISAPVGFWSGLGSELQTNHLI